MPACGLAPPPSAATMNSTRSVRACEDGETSRSYFLPLGGLTPSPSAATMCSCRRVYFGTAFRSRWDTTTLRTMQQYFEKNSHIVSRCNLNILQTEASLLLEVAEYGQYLRIRYRLYREYIHRISGFDDNFCAVA